MAKEIAEEVGRAFPLKPNTGGWVEVNVGRVSSEAGSGISPRQNASVRKE